MSWLALVSVQCSASVLALVEARVVSYSMIGCYNRPTCNTREDDFFKSFIYPGQLQIRLTAVFHCIPAPLLYIHSSQVMDKCKYKKQS